MKRIILAVAIMAAATTAMADQWVNGYTRSDGTYVNGYHRSTPDNSYNNNYGTRGNSNPYTGTWGSNSRTYNDRTPESNQRNYGYTQQDNGGGYTNGYNFSTPGRGYYGR